MPTGPNGNHTTTQLQGRGEKGEDAAKGASKALGGAARNYPETAKRRQRYKGAKEQEVKREIARSTKGTQAHEKE